jgi:hypothetical protein
MRWVSASTRKIQWDMNPHVADLREGHGKGDNSSITAGQRVDLVSGGGLDHYAHGLHQRIRLSVS